MIIVINGIVEVIIAVFTELVSLSPNRKRPCPRDIPKRLKGNKGKKNSLVNFGWGLLSTRVHKSIRIPAIKNLKLDHTKGSSVFKTTFDEAKLIPKSV